jgi:hypothetical protein
MSVTITQIQEPNYSRTLKLEPRSEKEEREFCHSLKNVGILTHNELSTLYLDAIKTIDSRDDYINVIEAENEGLTEAFDTAVEYIETIHERLDRYERKATKNKQIMQKK